MDPSFVTTTIWHEISVMLRFLWLYVISIIGFVTLFLVAHAFIPSLASTGQASQRIMKLRPILYLMAFGILSVAVLLFILSVTNTGWVPKILDRWWI